jgi:hypothetical protein
VGGGGKPSCSGRRERRERRGRDERRRRRRWRKVWMSFEKLIVDVGSNVKEEIRGGMGIV